MLKIYSVIVGAFTFIVIVQVKELTAAVERDKGTQKETAAKAKELEVKVGDIKGHRERYVIVCSCGPFGGLLLGFLFISP